MILKIFHSVLASFAGVLRQLSSDRSRLRYLSMAGLVLQSVRGRLQNILFERARQTFLVTQVKLFSKLNMLKELLKHGNILLQNKQRKN